MEGEISTNILKNLLFVYPPLFVLYIPDSDVFDLHGVRLQRIRSQKGFRRWVKPVGRLNRSLKIALHCQEFFYFYAVFYCLQRTSQHLNGPPVQEVFLQLSNVNHGVFNLLQSLSFKKYVYGVRDFSPLFSAHVP